MGAYGRRRAQRPAVGSAGIRRVARHRRVVSLPRQARSGLAADVALRNVSVSTCGSDPGGGVMSGRATLYQSAVAIRFCRISLGMVR